MTNEEAKALKKGDNIIIHAVVEDVPDVRDLQALWVELGSNDKTCLCVAVEDISVPTPKPKHDPCRKFKKGDKVRIVECLGRTPLYLRPHIGSAYTVTYDEDANGHVYIDGGLDFVFVPYLELVTPVEELELYRVELRKEENYPSLPCTAWCIFRGADIVAKFYNDFLTSALDLAEAECKRLNAAYRKEKGNDA